MVTSVDKLLQAINDANQPFRLLTTQNVDVGAPTTSEGEGFNSTIKVTGKPLFGYWGDVDVFYTRLDLATELGSPTVASVDPMTNQQLVDQLNQQTGLWLTLDDLQPFTIPTDIPEDGTAVVEIHATDASIGFMGIVNVNVFNGRPQLDVAIRVKSLKALVNIITPVNAMSARMVTWGMDFTCVRDAIKRNPTTQSYTDWDTLQAMLAAKGIPGWQQGIITDYATSALPDANQAFDRVVVQRNVYSSGIRGDAYLHYNTTKFDGA